MSKNFNFSKNYQVAVFGAGVGGLTCALELVNQGFEVVLIEQHSQVGGYCSSFSRRGFSFDAGAHLIPMLGNKSTVLGYFIQENNLNLDLVKVKPFEKINISGQEYFLPGDLPGLIKYLKQKFPLEKNLDLFAQLIKGALINKKIVPEKITYQDLLVDLFKADRLKTLLAAYSTFLGTYIENMSARMMLVMLKVFFNTGLFYIKGGSGVLAGALKKAFLKKGGCLLVNHEVKKIITGKNKVLNLMVWDKQKQQNLIIKAEFYVSNINLRDTFLKFIGKNKLEPDFSRKFKQYAAANSYINLFLGLKINPKRLNKYYGIYIAPNDPKAHQPLFVTIPNLYDSKISPPQTTILYAGQAVPAKYFYLAKVPGLKKVFEKYLWNKLKKIIPSLEAKDIIVFESASPVTYEKYTKNYHGSICGWQATNNTCLHKNFSGRSPFKNLYLAGHWVNPGGGVNSVMSSGLNAARAIVNAKNK